MGSAKLLQCDFYLGKDGRPTPPRCQPYAVVGRNAHWVGIGYSDATKLAVHSDPPGTLTDFAALMFLDPLTFVKKAIELETAANEKAGKSDVGGPITTATFDATGLHFSERGACHAQENTKK